MIKARIIIAGVALTISACAHQPERAPKEAQEALSQAAANNQQGSRKKREALPESVRDELRSNARPMSQRGSDALAEPRFAVQANDVSAPEFLASLAEDSPYSMVVHPDVKGSISLSLKDVTVAETLAVVEDMYGYDVRIDGRIVRVFPAGMRSETIALDYLSLRRMGLSQTSVSSGGVKEEDSNNLGRQGGFGNNSSSNNNGLGGLLGNNQQNNNNNQYGSSNQIQGNGSTISSESDTDIWSELEDILRGIIGDEGGRRVVVAPQAGLVTITALPAELRAAKEFLGLAEERLQRQVILEARIIEVTLNDEYQQGINWQDVLGEAGDTGLSLSGGLPNASSGASGIFGISISDGNFSGVLQLLQTQGNVQVLSNPRVSASNNQKAVIKIGEDEYYITDVSTERFQGLNSTSQGVRISDVDLTPFFSGISLDVTPQISADGDVTLHVHPSVVETREQIKSITLGADESVDVFLAQSNIRESDTVVRARNGEIVVLGGLMQTTYSDEEAKVPFFGDIPVLGNLFKSKGRVEQKKELIILLRPTVIGANTWQDELERSSELLQRWYPEK